MTNLHRYSINDYVKLEFSVAKKYGVGWNEPFKIVALGYWPGADGTNWPVYKVDLKVRGVGADLDGRIWVYERALTKTQPPPPTLAEKEAAAYAEDGWRQRRDEALRKIFREEPSGRRSGPDWV